MHFFAFNLENSKPENVYTDIVRGVCDNYQVCMRTCFKFDPAKNSFHNYEATCSTRALEIL